MPFCVPLFLGCGVIHHVLDTSQIMAEFVFIQFESLSILGKKNFYPFTLTVTDTIKFIFSMLFTMP